MTGSTPPRKGRSTAGAPGDLEDAWQAAEAAKKASYSSPTRVWGFTVRVSLRSHFNSFVLLVLVLVLLSLLGASVTTKNNGAADQPQLAQTVPPPADGRGAVDQPQQAQTVPPPADGRGDADGSQGEDKCDLSSGRWVYDESAYPLYKESACKFMSDQSACEKYGRTDLRYQHWRWQPHGCDLPRFDAARLRGELRDKRLAFVGDSLNRNQWVSIVCLIDTATPGLHKTMNSTGSLMSFKIHEYNASVDFYWSPLLVESNSDHPVHHRIADRIVRAASINKHARHWTNADVLVFNSYLWWQRAAMKVLWGSFDAAAEEDGYGVYKVIDSLRAYELAIATWSDWLEFHVDRDRTQLFFMTMSPTHLRSDEWEHGGGAEGGEGQETTVNHKCYNETEPITAEGYRGNNTDPAFARAVEEQVRRLGTRGVAVRLLNVTQLSDYRKDAHPSVHRRQWDPLTEEQERNPASYADCMHWCLPGVPDVWNQLLYAHIVS